MPVKYLVTLSTPGDAAIVDRLAGEIIAEYPDSMIVRCDEAQRDALVSEGIEITEYADSPVRVRGLTFAMSDAVATEAAVPSPDASRPNYYIVQLVGPTLGDWLKALADAGIEVLGNMQGNALLVKMMPSKLGSLQAMSWVEGVSSYRPALKVSPKLLQGEHGSNVLSREALSVTHPAAPGARSRKIEVTVFPGESVDPIIASLEAAGGQILSVGSQSVKAIAPLSVVSRLAGQVAVESIDPFEFPELHNDVARGIMSIPGGGAFSSGALEGGGQIVAISDSGLDTGNTGTVHQDVQGRVNAIVSWGTSFAGSLAPYINGPLNTDDGAADTNSGHGTHVTGSVAGNGARATASGAGSIPRGAAPQTNLYFQAIEQSVNWKPVSQLVTEGIPVPSGPWPPNSVGLYGIPADLNTLFAAAYGAGARIHTNSWGAPNDGLYNSASREVDQFMWNNRDMLIIYSAGNDGQDVNNDGQIDADSIGTPGTAKNSLTVGASENDRPNGSTPAPGANLNWTNVQFPRFSQMAAAGHVSDNPAGMACFSSRGPTDDGRIKPDVVAPGTNVLSMRSSVVGANPLWGDVTPASDPLNGDYCWSGGTSMATPLVAGLAALVREHLVTQRGHFQAGVKPSGALVKAFIINGATQIAGQYPGEVPAGPNNVTGFGLANAAQTVTPGTVGSAAFDDEPSNAVESGEIRTYSVQAGNLGEPLRATLCWTDRHSPGAGGLQNTLYLQVVAPGGAVFNGDTTPFPTVTNNVQQVTINNPVAGNYTVRVRGVSVTTQAPGASPGPNPRQDFALVISNGYGLNVPAPVFSILTPLTTLSLLTPVTALTPLTVFTPLTILTPFSVLTPLTVVTPLTPLTVLTPRSPILTPILTPIPSLIPSFLPPISRLPVPSPIPTPIDPRPSPKTGTKKAVKRAAKGTKKPKR